MQASSPNNFSFLRQYQQLQYDIMYDELIDLGFTMIGYSNADTSTYWNVALTNQLLGSEQLREIEDNFASIARQPTIYFERTGRLDRLSHFLQTQGYRKDFEDCFQFWPSNVSRTDTKHFDSVRKVNGLSELKIFLEVLDNCYRIDDPQNPYGELGDFLKVAEMAWHKHHETNRLEYFMVYKNDEPVAVAALTNYGGIGYISCIGSLQKVRGQGFGKAATLYCVGQSIKHGNTQHCLATEERHYPNEFYRRIGFAPRFVAVGYTKAI